MHKPLNQKVALVTGGSRGIGAAIVRRLVQEGADVAFTYSKSAKIAGALPKRSRLRRQSQSLPADAAVRNPCRGWSKRSSRLRQARHSGEQRRGLPGGKIGTSKPLPTSGSCG